MTPYKNLWGDSNIISYEIGSDSITVEFASGRVYTYTNASAGSSAVDTMKNLAECGEGLNWYISRNKPNYSSKR